MYIAYRWAKHRSYLILFLTMSLTPFARKTKLQIPKTSDDELMSEQLLKLWNCVRPNDIGLDRPPPVEIIFCWTWTESSEKFIYLLSNQRASKYIYLNIGNNFFWLRHSITYWSEFILLFLLYFGIECERWSLDKHSLLNILDTGISEPLLSKYRLSAPQAPRTL